MTAKLNDIDPQVADVLAGIADTPIIRLEQLLAWKLDAAIVDAQSRHARVAARRERSAITVRVFQTHAMEPYGMINAGHIRAH